MLDYNLWRWGGHFCLFSIVQWHVYNSGVLFFFLSIVLQKLGFYQLESVLILPALSTRFWLFKLYACSSYNSPTWKRSKCPSTAEWKNKLWYFHTMGYFTTMRINSLWLSATIGLDDRKPETKPHVLRDFIYMRFRNKPCKLIVLKVKIRASLGGKEGGATGRKPEGASKFLFLNPSAGYKGVLGSWNSSSRSPL